MHENVGQTERWLRTLAGGALTYAGIRALGRGQAAPVTLIAAGALMLETAITRVCPLNALLGIDAGKTGQSRAELEAATDQNIGGVQRAPSDS